MTGATAAQRKWDAAKLDRRQRHWQLNPRGSTWWPPCRPAWHPPRGPPAGATARSLNAQLRQAYASTRAADAAQVPGGLVLLQCVRQVPATASLAGPCRVAGRPTARRAMAHREEEPRVVEVPCQLQPRHARLHPAIHVVCVHLRPQARQQATESRALCLPKQEPVSPLAAGRLCVPARPCQAVPPVSDSCGTCPGTGRHAELPHAPPGWSPRQKE
jgi:hypothetical protein